jgi:predicted permease
MDIKEILTRVGFLIGIALIGIFIGKKFKVNQKDISTLLVYVISPAVMFVSVLQAPAGNYLQFSAIAFLFCSVTAFLAYQIGQLIWADNTKNLFAFSGGTGNTGYFGLPIALAMFDKTGAAVAVFIILGVNLYEFTVGYYITSLGHHSIRDSLKKVIKMPILYAFALAYILKFIGLIPNDVLLNSLSNFKGTYSILGMMVIGVTLSKFERFEIDLKFLAAALSWKYIYWPVTVWALIHTFGQTMNSIEKSVILLMACVPMAGNTVVIANELNVQPEKAATAVMISTLLAIVSVPLMMLFIN